MKLDEAKLCPDPDCGEVYEGDYCPCCQSTSFLRLGSLIDPKARALRRVMRESELTFEHQRRRRA